MPKDLCGTYVDYLVTGGAGCLKVTEKTKETPSPLLALCLAVRKSLLSGVFALLQLYTRVKPVIWAFCILGLRDSQVIYSLLFVLWQILDELAHIKHFICSLEFSKKSIRVSSNKNMAKYIISVTGNSLNCNSHFTWFSTRS